MIITCLNGGLGNQMFQYAAARSLADRLGESLRLDVRDLRVQTGVHRYRLDLYPIRAEIAGRSTLGFHGLFVSRKIRSFLKDKELIRADYIIEKDFTYQLIKAMFGRFTYLEGYWQSWKYFEWNRERILGDFTPRKEATGKNARLMKKMKAENAVCLHVRLGDYVASKETTAAHGSLTAAYYRAAIKKAARGGKRLSYYLFSDEPAKAVKLFGRGMKMTVVDHNQDLPHEDIRLMSACKIFITANSSFSWWAAWLSQRQGKKVIAPKIWFAGLKHDTKDLIPRDWIRI